MYLSTSSSGTACFWVKFAVMALFFNMPFVTAELSTAGAGELIRLEESSSPAVSPSLLFVVGKGRVSSATAIAPRLFMRDVFH